MQYSVSRLFTASSLDGEFSINADWDKPVWQKVQALELTNFIGDTPEHFPRTQAKLLYDDDALYVIFHVEDCYLQAVAKEHQGDVWKDSCVEFFFTPENVTGEAYFNLEMNCGGTMLLHHQEIPRGESRQLTNQELSQIEVAATQPKIVCPEVTTPTVWSVEYRLPISLLRERHLSLLQPAAGVSWRANFYKCGDKTSHPHWLTWAKIDQPILDFHVPKFFGQLNFQ